jgi:hypothetical protein
MDVYRAYPTLFRVTLCRFQHGANSCHEAIPARALILWQVCRGKGRKAIGPQSPGGYASQSFNKLMNDLDLRGVHHRSLRPEE